jgi:uncharacterized protein (DUF924 family)
MNAAWVQPQAVLDFWFDTPAAQQARPEWFRKDPAFDRLIVDRFGGTIQAALDGGLTAWRATASGTLAMVIVLDQFTRNTRRDTPAAFAGDAAARVLARDLVASGADQAMSPWQRSFAYLPFEHSENQADQDESLRLFAQLAAQHPALADAQQWALKHAQIVQRFGRYPHRNLVLGRVSTAAELAFLAQPGSSF